MLTTSEIQLLDSVFEPIELIPKNRKGEKKLRIISFFMTNTKAITNVCKNLEKVYRNETLTHHYNEVLRKMALLNQNDEITKYGLMLLKILHYNNNYYLNEINSGSSVEELPEEIPYTIEFFLMSVVMKCINDIEVCKKENIKREQLALTNIFDIEFFLNQVVDTLKEPTNSNTDFTDIFDLAKSDNYYVFQSMNYSGVEVKKLLRHTKSEINQIIDIYSRVLNDVASGTIVRTALSVPEQKYYDYAKYFIDKTQKDVRNRAKMDIFSYVLLNSISVNRKKIKINKNEYYDKIIKYSFIEDKFKNYNLADIYNLVYFERDSKYLTNEIKNLKLDSSIALTICSSLRATIPNTIFINQHINRGDSIIITDESCSTLFSKNIFYVKNISINSASSLLIDVEFEPREVINLVKKNEILGKL